jgi:hypothetical protein
MGNARCSGTLLLVGCCFNGISLSMGDSGDSNEKPHPLALSSAGDIPGLPTCFGHREVGPTPGDTTSRLTSTLWVDINKGGVPPPQEPATQTIELAGSSRVYFSDVSLPAYFFAAVSTRMVSPLVMKSGTITWSPVSNLASFQDESKPP